MTEPTRCPGCSDWRNVTLLWAVQDRAGVLRRTYSCSTCHRSFEIEQQAVAPLGSRKEE